MVNFASQWSLNFIKSRKAKQKPVCPAHTEKQYAHTYEYHQDNQPYQNCKKTNQNGLVPTFCQKQPKWYSWCVNTAIMLNSVLWNYFMCFNYVSFFQTNFTGLQDVSLTIQLLFAIIDHGMMILEHAMFHIMPIQVTSYPVMHFLQDEIGKDGYLVMDNAPLMSFDVTIVCSGKLEYLNNP